ncbi:hypothetical protein [Nocardia sp. CDC160]|uniref:hypothetical protein n=1 Tax=Nocardia sp. CDC160 TaxID=3112166 RepID=UPI002DBA270F|nr:hypothetical protein [Nocardia sp. CDC160]MEC3919413.1 hypothetical protein [Nocardia sp. CDC160]
MIVWTRWGILALPFVGIGAIFGFCIAALIYPDVPFGGPYTGTQAQIPLGCGFILSAVLMWVVVKLTVGKIIDKPTPVWVQRELATPIVDQWGRTQKYTWVQPIDEQTGQPMVQQPVSTLFFIPLPFLPYVQGIGGVVLLVIGAFGHMS